MLDTEAYTYICSYIKYYMDIYGHTHLEEIVDRGINQQEHPEIQQVPTHSMAAGNWQAGTRGAAHQLLGTALGTGGTSQAPRQQWRPVVHGQQEPDTDMRARGRISPLSCGHQHSWNSALTRMHTDKTATSLWEAAKSSMLKPLLWELRLCDHSWFICDKGWLWGHPTACVALTGRDWGDVACMVGAW